MGSVGGFFATLDLKTNTAAFEKGAKSLVEVGKKATSLKGDFKSMAQDIIGMTMKMGAAFLGLGAALGKLGLSNAGKLTELKEGALKAGGMNPLTFKLWTDAAKIAGGSAEEFAASLSELNKSLNDLSGGDASKLQALSKAWAVAFGNANFEAILRMKPEERTLSIMKEFERLQNDINNAKNPADREAAKRRQQIAWSLAEDAGLRGIVSADRAARARGTSILNEYVQAQTSNMTTGSDIETASRVDLLQNKVGNSIEQFFIKIGSEIGKNLEGPLKAILDWMTKNKSGLEDFAKAIGQLAGTIFDFAGKLGKLLFGDEGTLQGRHTASLFQDQAKTERNIRAKAAVGQAFISGDFSKLDAYGVEEALLTQANDLTRKNLSGGFRAPWDPVSFNEGMREFLNRLSGPQLKAALDAVQTSAVPRDQSGGRYVINIKVGDVTKEVLATEEEWKLAAKGLPIPNSMKQELLQQGPVIR